MEMGISNSEINEPQGQVCLLPGAKYMYDIQRSSSLKPFGQSKPNVMWSILRKGE